MVSRRTFIRVGVYLSAACIASKSSFSSILPNHNLGPNFTEWERPMRGEDYTLGVDLGGDTNAMVISVLRIGRDEQPDVQCGEFSAHVAHNEAWEHIHNVAVYYGQHMRESNPNEPRISVEQTSWPGDVTHHKLMLAGHRRFYNFIRNSRPRGDGWYTTAWSKKILTTRFDSAIANGEIIVNSPNAAKDIGSLSHNSNYMATSIAYITSHHKDFISI